MTGEAPDSDPLREPLVLIHGFAGSRIVWDPVLEELNRSFDVLVVSLAGHVGGEALPADVEASVAALVDGVERDMDAAGFETAHLVGNSLGGWIALELASRGRARSVVAIAPAGGWDAGTREERRLQRLFTRNYALASRLGPRVEPWLRRPRVRRALLRQVAVRGERIPAATAAQLIRDSVDCPVYFPLMETVLRDGPPQGFEGIACPVLLAWGTRDRIIPSRRYSNRLRQMLPASDWVDLVGAGHVPMYDDPALVTRTITAFMTRAREAAPAVSI
jgi:pimeloyl-ACP methyl ester carboxylesterase